MEKSITVRCKFRCNHMTKRLDSGSKQDQKFLYEYEFYAVYDDGNEENKKYFAYTPSGSLKVGTFRDDLFEPGREYFLDIIPAV